MPSNTNWNLYKYFLAVYETRNLHRAADLFAVSHSAVSQNIKELSAQLGAALFTANQKGVTPTAEGQKLYEKIQAAANLIDAAEYEIAAFDEKHTGEIAVGLVGWFAKFIVNDYIREFKKKFPRVSIKIINGADVELLAARKVDLIVGWDILFDDTNFKQIDLLNRSENGKFVASKNFLSAHNLGTQISVEELVAAPIIEQKCAWEKYWKKTNLPPFREIIDTDSFDTCVQFIKNDMGFGCMNDSSLKELAEREPEIVPVSVKNFTFPPVRLVCAFHSPSRPAAAFIRGLSNQPLIAEIT
jgi:DNA-binding transcriptional LysR family regulator